MKEFDTLLEVARRLNAPDGCPWDRQQSFLSLQPYVLEEAHEVIEAVDLGEDSKIIEELGDLLYTVIFYGKVAEREGRFTIREIIESVREKLIRRHPHVFGELKVESSEEVKQHWEKIKKQESGHAQRESALDGIPERLPALAKAQKLVQKALRAKHPPLMGQEQVSTTEKEIGNELFALVFKAEQSGIDVESALRRVLRDYETVFRAWEKRYTQTT